MMIEPESASSSAPLPETALTAQFQGPMRRFFRDLDSAGNLEDGMEFHAAGVVIEAPPEFAALEGGAIDPQITVLYLNPFTAKVERRERSISSVVLYEFPEDDGVYWRLWERTRAKLESFGEEP